MKRLKVIGFQGASRRFIEQYFGEDALIINGHVGYQFENDSVIYGFHPPEWSIDAAGGADAAFQKLKEHEAIPGTFQDGTEIFYRAYELSLTRSLKMGVRLEVYVMNFGFEDDAEYDKLYNRVLMLYNSEEDMPYSFPPITNETTYDNCATVLRHLGLRIINFDSHKGEMRSLIQVFQEYGEIWNPEQEEF